VPDTATAVRQLEDERGLIALRVAGERRYVAVEDVARYRDALGVPLPQGLPTSLLEPVRDPAGDLALRYARSHGPFTMREFAARYGLGISVAAALAQQLTAAGKLMEGEFRPGGSEREWVDPDVLRSLRRRSLARLRHEIEPVDADALGRFLVSWHGVGSGRKGLEAVLDAIEQLQGSPVPASVLEREVLPARVDDYAPGMLDTLMSAGEVVWIGVEPLGDRDGRVALYLTDHVPAPARAGAEGARGRRPASRDSRLSAGAWRVVLQRDSRWNRRRLPGRDGRRIVGSRVAGPCHQRHDAAAARLRAHRGREDRQAIAWRAIPLASPRAAARRGAMEPRGRNARDQVIQHRVGDGDGAAASVPPRHRHPRETVAAESVAGGFSAVYRCSRLWKTPAACGAATFVAGLGAAQFAIPAALESAPLDARRAGGRRGPRWSPPPIRQTRTARS